MSEAYRMGCEDESVETLGWLLERLVDQGSTAPNRVLSIDKVQGSVPHDGADDLCAIFANGCAHANASEWQKCLNVLMRGWRRVREFDDPRARFRYLMLMLLAALQSDQPKLALRILSDMQDKGVGDGVKSFELLKCQTYCVNEVFDARHRAHTSFLRAIEGEGFDTAFLAWEVCQPHLCHAGLLDEVLKSLEDLAEAVADVVSRCSALGRVRSRRRALTPQVEPLQKYLLVCFGILGYFCLYQMKPKLTVIILKESLCVALASLVCEAAARKWTGKKPVDSDDEDYVGQFLCALLIRGPIQFFGWMVTNRILQGWRPAARKTVILRMFLVTCFGDVLYVALYLAVLGLFAGRPPLLVAKDLRTGLLSGLRNVVFVRVPVRMLLGWQATYLSYLGFLRSFLEGLGLVGGDLILARELIEGRWRG